jgi:hypothetical protein
MGIYGDIGRIAHLYIACFALLPNQGLEVGLYPMRVTYLLCTRQQIQSVFKYETEIYTQNKSQDRNYKSSINSCTLRTP